MFDKDQVRKSMLLQKSYFHDLFSSNSLTCGTILASGSILNLNTLIKVLHFITIGEIPLSNQAIERLTKSRKAHFLHKKFKQKKLVRNLLNSNRQEKISVLVKVQKFLPDLLESLFVPPPEVAEISKPSNSGSAEPPPIVASTSTSNPDNLIIE